VVYFFLDFLKGSTYFRSSPPLIFVDTLTSRPTGACERHNLLGDILEPVNVLTTVEFHPTTTSSAHPYSIMRPQLLSDQKFLGRLRRVSSTHGGVRTFWHRRDFVVEDLKLFQLCDTDLQVPVDTNCSQWYVSLSHRKVVPEKVSNQTRHCVAPHRYWRI